MVLKMNEITGVEFNKNDILTYGLPTQKGLVKMRTSVDITPAYDEKGEEILPMHQKWVIVFYRILRRILVARTEK